MSFVFPSAYRRSTRNRCWLLPTHSQSMPRTFWMSSTNHGSRWSPRPAHTSLLANVGLGDQVKASPGLKKNKDGWRKGWGLLLWNPRDESQSQRGRWMDGMRDIYGMNDWISEWMDDSAEGSRHRCEDQWWRINEEYMKEWTHQSDTIKLVSLSLSLALFKALSYDRPPAIAASGFSIARSP